MVKNAGEVIVGPLTGEPVPEGHLDHDRWPSSQSTRPGPLPLLVCPGTDRDRNALGALT